MTHTRVVTVREVLTRTYKVQCALALDVVYTSFKVRPVRRKRFFRLHVNATERGTQSLETFKVDNCDVVDRRTNELAESLSR